MSRATPRIAIVGPCSSGKSTLVKTLKGMGYPDTRHVAQEHSYVLNMWQRITKPDILIYLDVDYPTTRIRRPYIDGGPQRVEEQYRRLAHAREHCDLYVDTSPLTPQEVEDRVVNFLKEVL